MRPLSAVTTGVVFSCSLIVCSEVHAQSEKADTAPRKLTEIIVNSTPLGQTLSESAQPVSVLSGDALRANTHSSLGETLADQPGVSSTSFGAGASRPVIRGLGADRIRVLQNGVGTQDVSNTSPDHAVAVDPVLVDKIEVVRGPAALLYGTSAVGGVVNSFDNRIPEEMPKGPVSGRAEIRGGTVDDEKAGIAKVEAPLGPFAVHVDGVLRDTNSYKIPGFARTSAAREAEPELEYPEPRGTLSFSDTEVQSGAVGGSYISERGFLGVSLSSFNTTYGVPNGENDISIDLEQQKVETRGQLDDPLPGVEKVRLNVGYVDYEHTEFEGEETGTIFKNEGVDSRLEFHHKPVGEMKGLLGFQFLTSDFSAIGEEAFQPPTDTNIYSAFLFEELPITETVKLQGGIRYDYSALDSDPFPESSEETGLAEVPEAERLARVEPEAGVDRNFSTLSGSTGAVWTPTPTYSYAVSLSYTERAPAGQELFANGPHVATAAFEVGDSDLDTEKSFGVDLTARKRTGRVTGSIGAFMNQFIDYINLTPTAEEEDGLQVYNFVAEDAQFFGMEAQVEYHLLGEIVAEQSPAEDLALFIQPDWVWAEVRDTGEALPRIPALRLRTGIEYARPETTVRLEYARYFDQTRTAEFETDTKGSDIVNASAIYRLGTFSLFDVSVFARGENLLNDKVRNHVSFIKDVAPLPGANLVGGIGLQF